MLKQAGAGGKDRIERQARLLQRNGTKKSNIEVRPGPEARRSGRCSATLSHKMCGTRAADRRGD
jgi:hypothetical protein